MQDLLFLPFMCRKWHFQGSTHVDTPIFTTSNWWIESQSSGIHPGLSLMFFLLRKQRRLLRKDRTGGGFGPPKERLVFQASNFLVVFNVRFREGNISDLLFQRAWLQFAHQFGHDLETQTLCQFNFTHTLKLNPKNCLTSAMSTRKSCQRWWQTVRWFYLSAQNNQDSIVHPKHACQSSMYSQHFLISGCSITSAIQWVIYFPVNPIILSKLMMNGCPMMSRLGLSSGTGRHMKIEVSWSFWVNILEPSKHHSSEAKMVYITLSLH